MTDMHEDRRDEMFPWLPPAQIARLSSVGERRRVRAGEVPFELGEEHTPSRSCSRSMAVKNR